MKLLLLIIVIVLMNVMFNDPSEPSETYMWGDETLESLQEDTKLNEETDAFIRSLQD